MERAETTETAETAERIDDTLFRCCLFRLFVPVVSKNLPKPHNPISCQKSAV